MNKSQLFKKAHQIAKSIVAVVGNYSVAFSVALKEVYAESSKSVTDKLIKAGGKVWSKGDMNRIYLNMKLVQALGLNINFNDKKHKLYYDVDAQVFGGSSKCFVSALNRG